MRTGYLATISRSPPSIGSKTDFLLRQTNTNPCTIWQNNPGCFVTLRLCFCCREVWLWTEQSRPNIVLKLLKSRRSAVQLPAAWARQQWSNAQHSTDFVKKKAHTPRNICSWCFEWISYQAKVSLGGSETTSLIINTNKMGELLS